MSSSASESRRRMRVFDKIFSRFRILEFRSEGGACKEDALGEPLRASASAEALRTANTRTKGMAKRVRSLQMRTLQPSPEQTSSGEQSPASGRSSKNSSTHSSPDKKLEEMKRAARLRIEREHEEAQTKNDEYPADDSTPRKSRSQQRRGNVPSVVDTTIDDVSRALEVVQLDNNEVTQHLERNRLHRVV